MQICQLLWHYVLERYTVVTSVDDFDMEFGKIENCAIINGIPFLLCRKLQTVGYERHFHGFRVSETNKYSVLKIADLKEPYPLGIYSHPNHPLVQDKFIFPKYKVLM